METAVNGYAITDREFRTFQNFIYKETGIFLPEGKRTLLVTRLSKRLTDLNLSGFSEYHAYLTESSDNSQEIIRMINRITTNKTDFFREDHHFMFLRTAAFPSYIESGKKNIRIWSAGCSTGEEPYSIAMEVAHTFGMIPRVDVKILATDLDTEVLRKAESGVYNESRTKPIREEYLNEYCEPLPDGSCKIKQPIKHLITFRRFNLMTPSFPFRKDFDIIFCRNVLIYFTKEDRKNLILKLRNILRPGGYLLLGHSESLLNQDFGLTHIRSTVYQKR